MTRIHDALQLAAVAMIYALSCVIFIRGWRVAQGSILTPNAFVLLVVAAYLALKAVKHTWFTARMLETAKLYPDSPFTRGLEVPIAMDIGLVLLGAAALFHAARPALGIYAAPVVVVSIAGVIGLGIWITQ